MSQENNTLLVHILDKVDKIEDHVANIRTDQVLMGRDMVDIKEDLRYHIKRTDLLESQVKSNTDILDVMVWPWRALCFVLKLLKLMK
jgi:hypothetical protein